MKPVRFFSALFLLFPLILIVGTAPFSFCSAEYLINQLTDNSHLDEYPQINNNGEIVWQGYDGSDFEIFFFDGTNIAQITDNTVDDWYPQINGKGYVVWRQFQELGSDRILLFDGEDIVQLSNDGQRYNPPQLNEEGHVVWSSIHGEVFLFNGINTTVISEDIEQSHQPQINDNGDVVWVGWDGSDQEIYLHDGTGIIQVTDNTIYTEFYPQINNDGLIAWIQHAYHVVLYDGTNTINISSGENQCIDLKLNNRGQAVWKEYRDGPDAIVFYDGLGTTTISTAISTVWDPQINDKGHAVWSQYVAGPYDIFLYDGTGTIQLTTNDGFHDNPQINDKGVLVWSANGDSTPGEEIWVATPDCTDADTDGYSTQGSVCGPIDCDDSDPDVNPAATEVCNGIDDDCDGNADNVDEDGDGYISDECFGGLDCNDNPSLDPPICDTCACGVIECAPCSRCQHPGAVDFQGDGVDSDCDGAEPPWAPASIVLGGHKKASDAVNSLLMVLLPLFAVLLRRSSRKAG